MSKKDQKQPEQPEQDEQQKQPEADVAYRVAETGRTVGAVTGRTITYQTGDVIAAPAGELDHLGGAVTRYQTRPIEAE